MLRVQPHTFSWSLLESPRTSVSVIRSSLLPLNVSQSLTLANNQSDTQSTRRYRPCFELPCVILLSPDLGAGAGPCYLLLTLTGAVATCAGSACPGCVPNQKI